MNRVKNFDATGIAPNGFLFAGDLNAIQDAAAAVTDFGQTISVSSLAVGESGLQILHFGSGEARISGLLRTDGIFRGLGGIYSGAFTTTQRNAIASGSRPYGLVITNTTTNQLEWNSNTDPSPTWFSVASDGLGYVNTQNGVTFGSDTTLHRTAAATVQLGTASQAGTLQIGSTAQPGLLTLYGQTLTGIRLQFINGTDTQPTFTQLTNGTHNWGPGGSTITDTSAARTAPGVLTFTNTVNAISGYQVNGTALSASHLSNGVTGTGAIVLANAPTFTGIPTSVTPPTSDNTTKVATTAWVVAQGYVSTTGIAVSSVFNRTGAVSASAGDYTAAQVTNAADKSSASAQIFSGPISTGAAINSFANLGVAIWSSTSEYISSTATSTFMNSAVQNDTAFRFSILVDGTHKWSTGLAASDTSMARTGAGILTVTNTVNALNGFEVNGVALAASHLSNGVSGSGAVALITSPTLVGTPLAPTAATSTNTQQIATTAFVNSFHAAQAATVAPLMNGSSAVGTSTLFARQDHSHPSDTSRASLSGATFSGLVTIPTLAVTGTITAPTVTTASGMSGSPGASTGALLNSGGVLQVSRSGASGTAAITITQPGTDTQFRMYIDNWGAHFWGAGGAQDVVLDRSAAQALRIRSPLGTAYLIMGDGANLGTIEAGGTQGLLINTSSAQKLGFFGNTPITRPGTGGAVGNITSLNSVNAFTGQQYAGTVGTSYYTVGDIVTALKNLGLIAA
jgi:hypothetical protein